MRTTIVLIVFCLAWVQPAFGEQVVILSQGSIKESCKGYNGSTPVTITKTSRSEAPAEAKRLKLALKAGGATFPRAEIVSAGSAYAIAVVQKKAGKCEWEVHMWRVSKKGAEAAKQALIAAVKSEPYMVSYSIKEAVALD